MGCTDLIRMKKEIIKWDEKAGIRNSGSCIIKMLPAGKWKGHYWKPFTAQKNIEIIKHCFVVDIITQHHLGYLVTKSTPDIECYGVYALNMEENRIIKILSRITVFATGGNGQVYRTTTNPVIATGDGVAMVYRAKGRIENMEFIQFHPTAFISRA